MKSVTNLFILFFSFALSLFHASEANTNFRTPQFHRISFPWRSFSSSSAGVNRHRRLDGLGLPSGVGWVLSGSHRHHDHRQQLVLLPRGGGDSVVTPEVPTNNDVSTDEASAAKSSSPREESLDDRVNAAMRRLGLGDDTAATTTQESVGDAMNCEGGVCTLEPESGDGKGGDEAATDNNEARPSEDLYSLAGRISSDMDVPRDIAMAAIGASYAGAGEDRRIDEEAARAIVQAEVDAIQNVPEDCDEVKQLVSEGFDTFFSRRSLAFTDMNIDDARAILIADQEDEEAERKRIEEDNAAAEREEEEKAAKLAEMKTVTVESNFDPLAATASPPVQQQPKQPEKPKGAPTPAKKSDVVFECTTENLQELVIESPVPVLLDVYADWCGPCKQLTPALEQICINAGGMLRLVKVNTDQQRQISSALEVKALPTIFGVRDGKILNSFQGMPRSEDFVRDFLMGLMVPGQSFNPPVSSEDKANYDLLSSKLLKLAAGASFSFVARERLQSKIAKSLDELVGIIGGETGMAVADDSAKVLRSLMSNVIRDPFEQKFRRIKLENKVIASKVAQYSPCMSILKSIGFAPEGDSALIVGKGKKVVNIAPFVVGRDCIDKWIDKNRYKIAAAARKRKDEIERARLAAEAEEAAKNGVDEDDEDDNEEEQVDPNLCMIKLRLEGKKKVHDIAMHADDPLSALVERLPFSVQEGDTVQLTCAARRLIVKSTDAESMAKTLSQLRLMPSASIVVKVGDGKSSEVVSGRLAERAASSQKKKTGSHSMHSIGLYAKDDGNKAELFDGGGGVLYEHDVTDDEEGDDGDKKDYKAEEKVEAMDDFSEESLEDVDDE